MRPFFPQIYEKTNETRARKSDATNIEHHEKWTPKGHPTQLNNNRTFNQSNDEKNEALPHSAQRTLAPKKNISIRRKLI